MYVVPANRHVIIEDGKVNMEGDHGDRPRPSVDLLLSTAARSYGERLIAVILTGSGSDGAAGAVDVKTAGGTVVIQNPRTAAHPSMPLALPPTAVDHVADLERIGALLADLVADARRPRPRRGDEAARLPELLDLRQPARRHRLPAATSRRTILRRIERRMAINARDQPRGVPRNT